MEGGEDRKRMLIEPPEFPGEDPKLDATLQIWPGQHRITDSACVQELGSSDRWLADEGGYHGASRT